ncbi:MAG: N-acetylmuramoyl-L-alanine amidase [Clostridia bacterium]|nr:N-acetylmuramoyl-L-alanine amidase [Clostridia bacterium]
MKKILLLLLLLPILFSCNPHQNNTESTETLSQEENLQDIQISADKESQDIISPLATENFLSPFDNFSWARESDIEYILIHFTSDVMQNPDSPYNVDKNKQIFIDAEVSVHYLIDRDGNIHCLIPENYTAWHAGKGTFKNDEKYTNAMNKYSIGIELLAIGSENDMSIYLTPEQYRKIDENLKGYTDSQYISLKKLLQDICQRNSIPYSRENIIGHQEYNPLKNDPGELFDWNMLFEQPFN